MIAREDENFFLVEVCVDLYIRLQFIPRASIVLRGFVAGFTVDEEERRIATDRVSDDRSFLLVDVCFVGNIDFISANVFAADVFNLVV